MRACGENPAAFKRKPEAESEHQRQQADAEARAQRWAEQKDADAMQELIRRESPAMAKTSLHIGLPLSSPRLSTATAELFAENACVADDMQAELFPFAVEVRYEDFERKL